MIKKMNKLIGFYDLGLKARFLACIFTCADELRSVSIRRAGVGF